MWQITENLHQTEIHLQSQLKEEKAKGKTLTTFVGCVVSMIWKITLFGKFPKSTNHISMENLFKPSGRTKCNLGKTLAELGLNIVESSILLV